MSIVQISQVKARRGLSEDLPQLASAELGWSVDTQELHIGNGTLAEGAPQVGNTRILTEHDILYMGGETQAQTITYNSTNVSVLGGTFSSNVASIIMNWAATNGSALTAGTYTILNNGNGVVSADDQNQTVNGNCGISVGYTMVGHGVRIYANVSNTGSNVTLKTSFNTLSF